MESSVDSSSANSNSATAPHRLIRRHVRTGWWSLAVFGTLGLVLETLHGFKLELYLNVGQETRRLMWTLAHAHGTLLALVQFAFAASIQLVPVSRPDRLTIISRLLMAAGLLIPAGFFAGGVVTHGSDPGFGILLVPAGAICLIVGAVLAAIRFRAPKS